MITSRRIMTVSIGLVAALSPVVAVGQDGLAFHLGPASVYQFSRAGSTQQAAIGKCEAPPVARAPFGSRSANRWRVDNRQFHVLSQTGEAKSCVVQYPGRGQKEKAGVLGDGPPDGVLAVIRLSQAPPPSMIVQFARPVPAWKGFPRPVTDRPPAEIMRDRIEYPQDLFRIALVCWPRVASGKLVPDDLCEWWLLPVDPTSQEVTYKGGGESYLLRGQYSPPKSSTPKGDIIKGNKRQFLLASGPDPLAGAEPDQEITIPDVRRIWDGSSDSLSPEEAKEQLAKDQLAKDQLAKDQLAKDQLAKDQLAKDQLAKDQLAKDQLAKDQLAKDQLAKAETARANERAARDRPRAEKESAKTDPGSQDGEARERPCEIGRTLSPREKAGRARLEAWGDSVGARFRWRTEGGNETWKMELVSNRPDAIECARLEVLRLAASQFASCRAELLAEGCQP